MKNKKINGYDVGIVFSIVGIGLFIFCFLSLFTNIKNKKRDM